MHVGDEAEDEAPSEIAGDEDGCGGEEGGEAGDKAGGLAGAGPEESAGGDCEEEEFGVVLAVIDG